MKINVGYFKSNTQGDANIHLTTMEITKMTVLSQNPQGLFFYLGELDPQEPDIMKIHFTAICEVGDIEYPVVVAFSFDESGEVYPICLSDIKHPKFFSVDVGSSVSNNTLIDYGGYCEASEIAGKQPMSLAEYVQSIKNSRFGASAPSVSL